METASNKPDITSEFFTAHDEIRSSDPRLRCSGAEKLRDLFGRFLHFQEILKAEIEQTKEELIPHLIDTTYSRNPYARSAALSCLGRLRADTSRQRAIECLSDGNPHVISAAILALGQIGPDSVADLVVPFLQDTHPKIKIASIRAVEKLNHQAALPILLDSFQELRDTLSTKSTKRFLKREDYLPLLQAIATLQKEEAIPLLTDLALNEVSLRSSAVKILSRLNAKDAAPALSKLLADRSTTLRREVIRFLVKLDCKDSLTFVRPLLNDADVEVRRSALSAILTWRCVECGDQVIEMALRDANPLIRVMAISGLNSRLGMKSIDCLLNLTDDPNPQVQKAVANSLGCVEIPTPEVIQSLSLLSRSETIEIRVVATEALAKLAKSPGFIKEDLPLPKYVPLPCDTIPNIPILIQLLGSWQQALPTLSTDQTIEEINETDAAISALLMKLRQARDVLNPTLTVERFG